MPIFHSKSPFYPKNEHELQKIDYAIQPFSMYIPLGYLYQFQCAYNEILQKGWNQDWTQAYIDNLHLEKVETYHIHVYHKWSLSFQQLIQALLESGLARTLPENAKHMVVQLAECDETNRERPIFRFGQLDIKDHVHVIARLMEACVFDILFLHKILCSNSLTRYQEQLIVVYLTARYNELEKVELPEDAPLAFPTIVKPSRKKPKAAVEPGALYDEEDEDEDEDDELAE